MGGNLPNPIVSCIAAFQEATMLKFKRLIVFVTVALLAGCAAYSRKPGGYRGAGGYGGNVRWTVEVPEPKGPLPVLALQPLAPPVELVSRVAAQVTNGAALQPLSEAPFLRDQGVKIPQEIIGVVE